MIRLSVSVPLALRLTVDRKAKLKVLRRAGSEVAAAARRMVRSSTGAGRTYWGPNGRYTASAPGAPPVSRTGRLAASIVVRPFKSGDGVAVRAHAFYALFLENGAQGGAGSGRKGVKGRRNRSAGLASARVLKPRPFLTAALEARGTRELGTRVRDALVAGIRLQRAKT